MPSVISPTNTTGDLPYSVQVGTPAEHVELATGNLIITIPFLNLPGRHLGFDYGIRYDAAFWLLTQFGSATRWNPEQRAWLTPDVIGWSSTQPYYTVTTGEMFCTGAGAISTGGAGSPNPVQPSGFRSDNPLFTDENGVKHTILENSQSNAPCDAGVYDIENGEGPSADESGLWNLAAPTGVHYSMGGSSGGQNIGLDQHFFNMTVKTDPRLNTVDMEPGGPDTIGRIPVMLSQPSNNQLTYSWQDSNGQTVQYIVNLVDLQIHTDLLSAENNYFYVLPYVGTRKVVSSIQTPVGSYTFQYNVDAEVTQMVTPRGVETDYTWDYAQAGCPGYVGYPEEQRRVRSRTVHNGASVATWTFQACGSSEHNSSFQPDSNMQVKVVFPPNASGVQAETDYNYASTLLMKVQQLSSVGGSPLRSYGMAYAFSNIPGGGWSNLSSITTSMEDGRVSKKEFDYDLYLYLHDYTDCSGQQAEQMCEVGIQNAGSAAPLEQLEWNAASRGNVTAIREYDWGSGAPGRLIRQTIRTYLADSNTRYFQSVSQGPTLYGGATNYVFNSPNIVDRVSSEAVYDGSAVCTGKRDVSNNRDRIIIPPACTAKKVSETILTYDYGTPDTSGYYGDVTAASRWYVGPGGGDAYANSTYVYDGYGNLISATDPEGHTTTINYSDSWSGTATPRCMPSQNSYAYPTSITNALQQETHLSYFPCTGLKAAVVGPNDLVNGTGGTRYGYDFLGRPLDVWSADGGHSSTVYDDQSLSETATVTMDGQHGVVTKTIRDGLGKPVKIQTLSDPSGIVTVETTYDALDEVWQTSNPYRDTGGATYGVTQFGYDALGRRVLQTNPDGTAISTQYAGNITTITDEAGNRKDLVTDALGRLEQVTDLGSAVTEYRYDPLGNLRHVHQFGTAGEVARERHFTYDSLSRLITSENPETGTICYGQWLAGVCQGGYDGDGDLLYKTDARGQVLSYGYDALNRMVSKSYGGTQVAGYWYDGTFPAGIPGVALSGPTPNQIGRVSYSWATTYSGANKTDQYFGYDPVGRLKHWTGAAPSELGVSAHSVDALYDLAGHLTDLAYPDGRTVAQHFDGAGRLDRVSAGTSAAPGAAYVPSILYNPDGTPQSMGFGQNVNETITENSRLQPCRYVASDAGMTLMNREYFHTATTGDDPCGAAAGNNGNIWHIDDKLPGGQYSQTFQYDGLNRLKYFLAPNMSGKLREQIFEYDSFGNMRASSGYSTAVPSDVGTPQARMFANPGYDPSVWPYDGNNRLTSSAFDCTGPRGSGPYDAAGNLLCGGSNAELNAQQYTWDAESRLTSIGVQHNGNTYDPTALYTYDAGGDRTRVDQFSPGSSTATSWREYTYFNGQMVADQDNTGAWTDYIYANGHKIAKVASQVPLLHLHGRRDDSVQMGWGVEGPVYGGQGAGTVIAAGDQLAYDFLQTIPSYGGLALIFDNGAVGAGDLVDAVTGTPTWFDGTSDGRWHHHTARLDGYVGHTLAYAYAGLHNSMPSGIFDMYYGNIVILHADGTVTPIYTGQSGVSVGSFAGWNGGARDCSSATEVISTADPAINTNYFLADHLGTTQMELSAGGWPLWEGQFAPFGQEFDSGSTAIRYKFTGKERDAESGLDYFGARYYASSMGRWMSPDWSAKEEPVPYAKLDNPQSLNLYGYVGNNPLSRADADGHQQEEDAEGEAELAMARNARNGLRPITPEEAIGWVGLSVRSLLHLKRWLLEIEFYLVQGDDGEAL